MPTQPLVKMVKETELEDEAKNLFEQMKQKSGDVPKWMKVMGNCPDILLGFFSMFKATMDDAPLDSILKWKAANAVSELNKCEFCVSVAEMKLKALGCEDVEAVTQDLNQRERLAVDYAKQATEHAFKIDQELIEQVKQEFTDEEIVELTAVIGLFNYINRFNDALRILPD